MLNAFISYSGLYISIILQFSEQYFLKFNILIIYIILKEVIKYKNAIKMGPNPI